MSTTTVPVLVAALLLLTTGLAATPADAHWLPIRGRYRGRGGWPRRYWPPATPTQTPPPTPLPAPPCTCARPPPARSAADVPDPDDCVTPLAAMMTCNTFLTGTGTGTSSSGADAAPAPGAECCAGLAGFFHSAAVAGDSQLKCLCPVIRGEVNELLPTPVDPARIMYLPSACGVVFPPQVIPLCLNASSRFFVTRTPPVTP